MSLFRRREEQATPTTPVAPPMQKSVSVEEIDLTRDMSDVLRIENAAFPCNMRSDVRDLLTQLGKGFGLVARRTDCRNPAGYVAVMPLEQAHYKGCIEDRSSKKTAYVESLAIMPSEKTTFLTLVRKLADQLEQKGFQRATMHVEAGSDLYKTLVGLGGREISRFDNWFGWGKTFAYVEVPLG